MTMNNPVNIIVYSDYMCPWCCIAAIRLQRIKEEYGAKVAIRWKSYPLTPAESPGRRMTPYIQNAWLRAGQEEPSIQYNCWPDSRDLPTSSMPAQEAAKCAQLQGEQSFERFHMALMKAFFEQNRDISSREVLVSLAQATQLDSERFISDFESGTQRAKVLEDYVEGLNDPRFSGVPTTIFDNQLVLEAAVPIEVYRRAVDILWKGG